MATVATEASETEPPTAKEEGKGESTQGGAGAKRGGKVSKSLYSVMATLFLLTHSIALLDTMLDYCSCAVFDAEVK